MPNKDTGGPAFPATVRGPQEGRNMKPLQRFEGMTMRDYFAAKAMQGMMADSEIRLPWSSFANDSYAMADAMLEARK